MPKGLVKEPSYLSLTYLGIRASEDDVFRLELYTIKEDMKD
jgi:hypothetical protein